MATSKKEVLDATKWKRWGEIPLHYLETIYQSSTTIWNDSFRITDLRYDNDDKTHPVIVELYAWDKTCGEDAPESDNFVRLKDVSWTLLKTTISEIENNPEYLEWYYCRPSSVEQERRSEIGIAVRKAKDQLTDSSGLPFNGWFKTGVSQAYYKHGVLNGPFIVYFNNEPDTIYVMKNYKNGILDGKYLEFYKNGLLHYEATFKAGKRHGPQKHYDQQTGKLIMEMNYVNDIRDGPMKKYWLNGNVKNECVFKNGLREGQRIEYYINGSVHRLDNYSDDKLHGVSYGYDRNGAPLYQMDYRDGLLSGEHKEWDKEGNLTSWKLYHKGVLMLELPKNKKTSNDTLREFVKLLSLDTLLEEEIELDDIMHLTVENLNEIGIKDPKEQQRVLEWITANKQKKENDIKEDDDIKKKGKEKVNQIDHDKVYHFKVGHVGKSLSGIVYQRFCCKADLRQILKFVDKYSCVGSSRLVYKDSDGDNVIIGKQQDLFEALKVSMDEKGIVRLYVFAE